MRKMRDRNSGTLTWLKNGAPTLTLTPRTASERRGNTVPKKTVNAAAMSSTLLRRNADSRETTESSSPCERKASQRHATRPSAVSTTSARKPRNSAPIEPCVKAWTEAMTPERVRNVPKSVRPNVKITSTMFRSEERRVGKGVDLGGRRIIKKKKKKKTITAKKHKKRKTSASSGMC